MAHHRRPTLSPRSLAELSRRLHEDDPAPERSLGWLYRRVLAALSWSVAALWGLLVIAAPVILVLTIFTPYNWTVEWLTAAADAFAFSLLVLFVALAESAVTAARARRGWRRVLPFVWLAIGALSCLFAAWFFLDPFPAPKMPFDRLRLMASGAWLSVVVMGVHVWSGVRERDQPPLARWCSAAVVGACILFGLLWLWSLGMGRR